MKVVFSLKDLNLVAQMWMVVYKLENLADACRYLEVS